VEKKAWKVFLFAKSNALKKIIKKSKTEPIDLAELREIVNSPGIKIASSEKLESVKKTLAKRWGKDWRASSPILRDVIKKSTKLLYRELDESLHSFSVLESGQGFDDPKKREIFEEVFRHLKLFSINLKNARQVANIYFHH